MVEAAAAAASAVAAVECRAPAAVRVGPAAAAAEGAATLDGDDDDDAVVVVSVCWMRRSAARAASSLLRALAVVVAVVAGREVMPMVGIAKNAALFRTTGAGAAVVLGWRQKKPSATRWNTVVPMRLVCTWGGERHGGGIRSEREVRRVILL